MPDGTVPVAKSILGKKLEDERVALPGKVTMNGTIEYPVNPLTTSVILIGA
jgi:hypothetical protein